ncbi:MAG: kelch repeat-containing protein, partial [Gallionellaceae bacterium]|nr:kelch repeat-containing protein [Gallionellaceae bacterium]
MKKLLFAWMGLLLSGMNAVAAPTLTAITITPSRPTISVGQTQQFTATGMFSDGASRALIGGGGVWADKTPMSAPRYYYAVGVVNSTLYAVGGINGSGSYSATVEAYDPATNIWTPRASMFTPRYGHAVGVVNGTLYAVGGYNYNVSGSGSLATMEAYDPVTNTWTPKASMLTPREGLAVGVVNGILYAVGGYDYFSNTMFATVEAYDPVTDTWTPKASMPTPRAAFAVGVVNGTLYAVGGNGVGRSISPLSTVEAYD